MSTTKHTAEPWRHTIGTVHDEFIATRGEVSGEISVVVRGANRTRDAARIVACVNACAGIKDPAKALSDVRSLLRSWKRDIECPDDRQEIDNILRALGGAR